MLHLDHVPDGVLDAFAIAGEPGAVERLRRGHIHDTFVSTWRDAEGERRYLHQHLNDDVFRDVAAVMHNVELVTGHLRAKAAAGDDGGFDTLELVPARADGACWVRLPSGAWRTYRFVENTETFDLCRDAEHAWAAARAFGAFQARLGDLDPARLAITIPDFFSSPHRLAQLDQAARADRVGRAASVADELRFVDERRTSVRTIDKEQQGGRMPVRVVHGDTKLNNVLFDRDSGRARCVVDLDTCMPAWSLYDFGDLVRFTAATCAEDEPDVARAGTDMQLYRALVDGYLSTAGGFLTAGERALMPFAARLVTMTIGMRFLADYLDGDRYFQVAPDRPRHNLERARVQFAMVRAMEAREREMRV